MSGHDEPRHYRVLDVLGQGGFGKVYRAECAGGGVLARRVALKILHPGLPHGDDVARRLRDEARMLAVVRYRAIVKVESLIRVDGRWCAAMEYVEGADLRTVMRATGPVPTCAALELVAELAGALDAAYNTLGTGDRPIRLIHRDVKPSNVQITALGEVKLLDFGIARADLEDREAQTRSVAYGSLDYMAPERFLFESGPEGDVYAVGMLLAELVLGRTLGRTLPAHRPHQARVTTVVREVAEATGSGGVAELVERLLTFVPGERPDAREAQRQAQILARTSRGEPLREWAEQAVPRARADARPLADALCGETLREAGRDEAGIDMFVSSSASSLTTNAGGAAPPSHGIPTRPDSGGSASRWIALAFTLVALGGAALFGLGGLWLLTRPGPSVVVEVVPTAPAPPEPTTPAASPAAASPAAASPAAASPAEGSSDRVRSSKPPPGPAPEAVAQPTPPTPTPTPTAGETGHVVLHGDASSVVFVGEAGTFGPGPLPEGAYEVFGGFGAGAVHKLGRIVVTAGKTTTLLCREAFGRCVER